MPEEERSSYARWEQRPALGTRGLVLAVVLPVLIAAGAFGVVALVSHGKEPAATAIKVPTSGWIPGQDGGDALIRGSVSVDEHRCVYLQSAEGRLWPVWPAGFRAYLDDAGDVSLYDGDDDLVAREGQDVQASGSYTSSAGFAGETCLPKDGDVAVVQSEVTRLG
jgi:ABC-type Na+ efflux pump permease subunit